MRGRALLLGSATGALVGVANDVDAMSAWLGELGFHLDVRQGPDATREGMLDGLARLARDVRAGEAVALYYSGHGGFVHVRPEARFAGGRFAPRAFQYLVPTDHDKHRSFRGIFRAELSSYVRALSERTANVTVILDCCHSTDMVRDSDVELKSVVVPWSEGIEAHVAWLEQQGYDLERLPELRSDAMVLVSACAVMHRAYEYRRPTDGLRCGQLTDSLLEVARRLSDPTRVTWDALMRRVAERMGQLRDKQRPQVSGPVWRCMFSERRTRRSGALTLRLDVDRWYLGVGAAAGVMRGDRYCIVDPLADEETRPLAEFVVEEVDARTAALSIVSRSGDRLEPGTLALPQPGGPTHQRCCIEGSGALVDELRRRLVEVPGLEVAPASERAGAAFVLAVKGAEIDVLDGEGRRLRWPWCDAPELDPSLRGERLDGFVEELLPLVRASDLLALARRSSRSAASKAVPHILEWGVVENGVPRPLPLQGAELTVGDFIYVSVENTGFRPIHVSLLDVGVSRQVTLLNRNEPEGIDLGAGETELFGAPEFRSLRGIELEWPDEVPPDGPHEESLIIFVSSEPLPVGSWETDPPVSRKPSETRSGEPEQPRAVGLAPVVHHVSFLLHPRR